MSPLSLGNVFMFNPYDRPGAVPYIYVMVPGDGPRRAAASWPLDPGETFMLVEVISNPNTSTSEWQVLSRGRVGSIYVAARERQALRLMSQA